MSSQDLVQVILLTLIISIMIILIIKPILSSTVKKLALLLPPRYLKYKGMRYKSQSNHEK